MNCFIQAFFVDILVSFGQEIVSLTFTKQQRRTYKHDRSKYTHQNDGCKFLSKKVMDSSSVISKFMGQFMTQRIVSSAVLQEVMDWNSIQLRYDVVKWQYQLLQNSSCNLVAEASI